ncbi:MAG: F0F1 ATP synthase subunit alpha, partial [Planctomycetota bacterium]
IPTNVISITDGQIYLEPDLFYKGVRPAINVGISVSRVGGNAQIKAMKKIAGSLRLDLAAFRELEAFAQLGTELDPATQKQLDRGARMVELLKQPQYQPFEVVDQVLSIYAASKSFMDDVDVKHIADFEKAMLNYFAGSGRAVRDELASSKALGDDINAKIDETLRAFKSTWSAPA